MMDLRENERIDDLQRGGLRVIQRTDAFRFGTDAVLLSAFAQPRRHDRLCDLGTGTGVIPLLLYGREPTLTADAIELQPDMADMAARSMALNGLADTICVHAGDLRDRQYVAFFDAAALDQTKSIPVEQNARPGDCRPAARVLFPDVHHFGPSLVVKMCKIHAASSRKPSKASLCQMIIR